MSSIEQSLSLLLPSLSEPLPSELVTLSNSLLAQSRNKASNLKPEEEIARPYACCEIACRRLGAKLRLPPLQGRTRPPCGPRAYKKLLAFLEQALPAKLPAKATQGNGKDSRDVASAARSTPRKGGQRNSLSTPQSTPTKRNAAFAGKVAQGHTSDPELNDDGAPLWVMPLIRRLCQGFSAPLLAPHVYTGLCVILGLADLKPGREDEEHIYRREVKGLALALFFMVLSRMQKGKVSSEGYVKDCETACALVNDDGDGEGEEVSLKKEHVDSWIKMIASESWATGQDWWSSVPEEVFDRAGKPSLEDIENDHDMESVSKKKRRGDSWETEQDPEHALLPGLGTMMQESIDWLSEDRRADYLDWRAKIEERLDRLDDNHGRPWSKRKGITAR